MKKSRKLLMILGIVLSLAIATGSTLAYLTDTDSDVNVMTLGNVSIKQIEKERIEQSDDNTAETNVQDFTQGKPLYPAVGPVEWNDEYQKWETGGSNQLFTSELNNVVDKFVFVENDGKSDAYVRTWFAFEQGSMTEEEFEAAVGQNINGTHWEWETVAYGVEIDGNKYAVKMATYKGSDTVHPGGILPAGETTRPSLLQTMLYKTVTNEDCEAIDGNGNGTFDIIVLSQAVQTAGFADASTALEEAFGEPTPANVPWEDAKWPIFVHNAQELKDAMLIRDAEIYLANDIIVDADTPTQWGSYMFVANGREVTVNLNGNDIIMQEDAPKAALYMFTTANGGTLNIVGEGEMKALNKVSGIFRAMNKNDQINVYSGTYYVNGEVWADAQPILYTNSGNIDVYGGTYLRSGHWCSNAEDIQGNRVSIIFHEGPVFIENDIQQGDSTRIKLEDGCSIQEVEIDGETWYKVVKE